MTGNAFIDTCNKLFPSILWHSRNRHSFKFAILKGILNLFLIPTTNKCSVKRVNILVASVHGCKNIHITGDFYLTESIAFLFPINCKLISIEIIHHADINNSIFADAVFISVKKLEYISENCRSISSVDFLNNKSYFLCGIANSLNQCKSERTGIEDIFNNILFATLALDNFRKYLTDKISIRIILIERGSNYSFIAIFTNIFLRIIVLA